MELDVVQTTDFLSKLVEAIGGLQGASTLAIVATVVQLLIMFLKTPLAGQIFKKLTADLKLLVVTGLTVVSTFVGLMLVEGMTAPLALIHGTVLSALSVFAHQLYKHLVEKKDK